VVRSVPGFNSDVYESARAGPLVPHGLEERALRCGPYCQPAGGRQGEEEGFAMKLWLGKTLPWHFCQWASCWQTCCQTSSLAERCWRRAVLRLAPRPRAGCWVRALPGASRCRGEGSGLPAGHQRRDLLLSKENLDPVGIGIWHCFIPAQIFSFHD